MTDMDDVNKILSKCDPALAGASPHGVSVRWVRECAVYGSVLAIALACTGLWQPALGMIFWAWVTYYDARAAVTASNDETLRRRD